MNVKGNTGIRIFKSIKIKIHNMNVWLALRKIVMDQFQLRMLIKPIKESLWREIMKALEIIGQKLKLIKMKES